METAQVGVGLAHYSSQLGGRFRVRQEGALNRARSAHLAHFCNHEVWCGRFVDPFVKVKGLFMDFINLGSGHWRHSSNVFVPLLEPSHNDGFCYIFAAGGGANCGIRGVGFDVWSRVRMEDRAARDVD